MRMQAERRPLPWPMSWARLVTVATIALAASGLVRAADPPKVHFNRDIRPIMSDTCFKCHGPGTRKAGLRLDLREEALKQTESGATPIVPGKPEQSEVVRRVLSTDRDEFMPPPDSHKTLSPEQKELFRRWIAQGAVYEKHWSFEPPIKTTPPRPPEAATGLGNPIDAFVADRLRREGMKMSPQADRETLIRRVAFATTGLPPTPGEVDAFLADKAPDAYEKMVDRFLGSEHYGEEMARHWLDVARYADTHGLHLDNERQMWAYRDWVIRSFNQDKPFDQFTIEQLAGDLLPGATPEQLTATGFIRCNVTTGEGGSIDEEWVYRNALDRTTTMAEAWMGLTAGCCVCHDHKFDPLPAKAYYSMYAFFHSAADPPLDGNVLLTQPAVKLTTPADQRRLREFDAQIAAQQKLLDDRAAAVAYTDPATVRPHPPVQMIEQVWFDDEVPTGARLAASPGHAPLFVTAENGKVLSGKRALKRTDKGLAQDVFEGAQPLDIPVEGRLFVHVWIDEKDPPKALMFQFFKAGWLHRAVWGQYDAIDFGRPNTTERVLIGPLPKAGAWARLEVEANRLGLMAGDQVTGFAFTQYGGTVFWDKAGAAGRSDPASDPRRSMLAWWRQQTGKDTPGVPADLLPAVKAGPDKPPAAGVLQKLRSYYLQNVCLDTKPQFEALNKGLSALLQQRNDFENGIPSTFIFRDLDQPRQSFVMLRGQYNKPGEKVDPGVPSFLPPLKKSNVKGRANRLDLARWLVAPEHPLTARVTVNRFWQQFFGVGLVKTSYDFGSQGEAPSHPELLDWLAVSFRESGWKVKDLVRLMLTSSTFRQSSQVSHELARRDPENRLYARGPRFRLDAEQLRDNALFVSGLLNPTMGGRGSNPYQPPNIWEPVGFVGSNTANYTQDHGPALYRRSIYTFLKRTAPPPFMSTFDAPSREMFCTVRDRSNTPLQALQLMNDVQQFEAARVLAQRLLTEAGPGPQDRIALGYRFVLARRPAPEETAVAAKMVQTLLDRYRQHPESARQVVHAGESPLKPGLAEPELAAYTLLANLLLNLDETVVRN
jgi:hypothetical protein